MDRSVASAWSRFRMTLWALRIAVLGCGPWHCIRSESSLRRTNSSPRKRPLQAIPLWLRSQ